MRIISCLVASFACSGSKLSPRLREEEVDLSLPALADIKDISKRMSGIR